MPTNPPTIEDVESGKAKIRIDFYLTGGSRLVYVSRWIVTGIVVVFWLAIWLRGLD